MSDMDANGGNGTGIEVESDSVEELRQQLDVLEARLDALEVEGGGDADRDGKGRGGTGDGYDQQDAVPFPWRQILFGFKINGEKFTVLHGQIHFRNLTYEVAETELTIAADRTFIYGEMEWGTGLTSIKQTTTEADTRPSNSCFRKWLYCLSFTAPSRVTLFEIGHFGGAIDIMPVFG